MHTTVPETRTAMLEHKPALHPVFRAAFVALEQAGVRWCLLRTPSNLEAPTDDVDLLVARSDAGRIRDLLGPLGLVPLPGHDYTDEAFFLMYHPPTDRWIKVHTNTSLSFGRYQVHWAGLEQACLARRRRDGALVLPDPDDAFWLLLLHCLLDKRGTFANHHRERLAELVGSGSMDGPVAQKFETIYPAGWDGPRILESVRNGNWAGLRDLAPSLQKAWIRKHPIGSGIRAATYLLSRLTRRLRAMPRRRGLSAALLGPDGAGKSTLAAGICHTFGLPARSVYMGLRLGGAAGEVRADTRIGRLVLRPVDIAVRPLLLWRRYLTARYHQALGRLVIFDRYIFDALLPPRPPFVLAKRVQNWLLSRTCPTPDLVYLLDVPGSVMFLRKGEQSPVLLEERRQQFLALAERIPQLELEIVDAAHDPDTLRIDVTSRIWLKYHAHWRSDQSTTP